MDFETPIHMSPADKVAAEAVRGLTNIRLGGSTEFVIQQIKAKARSSPSALREARTLDWVLAIETTSDFQYFARVYTDGKPLAPGSLKRVLDLLSEADRLGLQASP